VPFGGGEESDTGGGVAEILVTRLSSVSLSIPSSGSGTVPL